METIAVRLLLALIGLTAFARTRVTMTLGTAHVSTSALGALGLVLALAAAAGVLYVARQILRDMRPAVKR